MTKFQQIEAADLRRRAIARLKAQKQESGPPRTLAQTNRILHELQVHQIELEMQNAELEEARESVESLLETYTDLYDFAPIGYFSVSEQGKILEVNLTGATLLQLERARLLNRRLQVFVEITSRAVFQDFFKKIFTHSAKQSCEIQLVPEQGHIFWVDLQAVQAGNLRNNQKWSRIAISDLSTLRREQEARRRLEGVVEAYRELKGEIVQRHKVEASLKKSETNLANLLVQSEKQREQLSYLSRQLLRTQEEERKRISRELHDEIVQTLLGINVHLANLTVEAPFNIRTLRRNIAKTQKLVEKSVQICHRFARELRPTMLDDLGLIPALKNFIKEFTERTKIEVGFHSIPEADQLDGTKRTVIYRVIQSALSNVDKHAEATQLEITMTKLQDSLQVVIHDNGKSFEVERVLYTKRHRRLGLLGSRERVEMVGGHFKISSTKGLGTTISVQIPFTFSTGASLNKSPGVDSP